MNTVSKALATALGAGYSPVAPGTCGTLAAIPLAWALGGLSHGSYAIACVVLTLIGVAAADRAGRAWGTEDDQRIVIDEVAGYLITLAAVERTGWTTFAVAFVVFRFFDIVKPPPVRWLDEHLPGGWGVVLDDVAAGVLGAIVMALLAHFGALAYLAAL